VLADVTVAIGCAAEDVDRTSAGGVLLAPAAALQDLGALVLGDHALDLNQEVFFGSVPRRIAQKDNFNIATSEFLEYQYLTCIFS
jgi:hypothetical protein